jgi:hypothetical protein
MDQVSPQGCRAIISRFYEALNARDVDGVLACYHPAAMIEVVAPSPFGGEFPPSETPLTQLFSIFPELVFEIDGFVTEEALSGSSTSRGTPGSAARASGGEALPTDPETGRHAPRGHRAGGPERPQSASPLSQIIAPLPAPVRRFPVSGVAVPCSNLQGTRPPRGRNPG